MDTKNIDILFLSQGLPFPIYHDGVTVRVFHLLREFSKYANVHLIAFGDYNLSAEERCELETLCTFEIIDLSQGKRQTALSKVVSSHRFFDKRFERSVKEAMSHFDPDVVFCEQPFIAQYAHLIGETPKVMSAVDAISLAAQRKAEIDRSALHRLTWQYVGHQRARFEATHYPNFDIITAVSKEDADYLARMINREVFVIPNGVDLDYFAPSQHCEGEERVVFTGNLSAPMNDEAARYLLREVYPPLKAQQPDLDLAIAGRRPSSEVRTLCQNDFSLLADLDDLRSAYDNALIYVSPIAYGTGIKNNVLQAMAFGLPALVTPLIARPIGIEHSETGFVAERGAEFSEMLNAALADRSRLKKVGTAARTLVEKNFSWASVAGRYLEIFNKLLTQNARSKR